MLAGFKVVETDNFGGDYPNEKFATPYTFTNERSAELVARALNDALSIEGREDRYCKVVPKSYKLQPGFEP